MMYAKKIEIRWHPGLPIFASEPFLKAVGDEYGWLGGFDHSGNLKCILPYTLIRRMIFRMVRFRVETIPVDGTLDLQEEKSFLDSSVEFFRSMKADIIIPASNNAIFRTFPNGAVAAPYGSYFMDLTQQEEILWQNIQRIMRQNISTARKKGVVIRIEMEKREAVYLLIRDTFRRSKLPFMNYTSFERFIDGLGENGKIMVADYGNNAQSCAVFAFSDYCAYAVYAGNIPKQQQGSNKLLYWEAIRLFKQLGIQRFDFYGARINPEEGSKQAELAAFKKRFGTELKIGYMWKYPLNFKKYKIYNILRRLQTGGDIVDIEHYKLHGMAS